MPALRALRAARPDITVALVTWAETAPVVDRMSAWIDELIDFPGHPGIPERAPTGALPSFLAWMRKRRFDLAVQAYGDNPAANEVTAAIGARITSGFQPTRGPRRDPATHLPYPHQVHEIHRHLQLVAHLGVLTVGMSDALEWPLTDADRRGAARLRAAYDLRPGHYVVVHPGA
ncbi:MAG: glycosyltransferase family 9 protein, partial [Actinomycetota bacterium]|nr:glycosyltransferase family 9 protein [Actinomycetota bacterium]